MVFTALILLLYAFCELWGMKRNDGSKRLLDKDTTNYLKGICCVVVVFAHISPAYQDSISSVVTNFGYIVITMYFMFSAYGLMYSVHRKPGYLNVFFKNRILILLIPYIVSIIVKYIGHLAVESGGTGFVRLLILYYIIFYLLNRFIKNEKVVFVILCLYPLVYSFVGTIFGDDLGLKSYGFGWFLESIGLLYGVVLERYYNRVQEFLCKKQKEKFILFLFASLITGATYVLGVKEIMFWGNYLLRIALSISIIGLVLVATMMYQFGNKAAYFLGDISFSIFLWHGLVLQASDRLHPNMPSGLYILINLVLILIIAVPFHYLDNAVRKKIRG